MKKFIFVIAFALLFVTSTASAQTDDLPKAGLVPGNFFYVLDTLSEGIGNVFTFGDVAKSERYLNQASERLAEARELVDDDKMERAEKATERYQERLSKALEKAEKAQENGKDTEEVLQKITDATSKHQEVLSEVLEKVPEEARKGIQNAMDKSQRGHDRALEAAGGADRPGNATSTEPGSQGTSTDENGAGASGNATSTRGPGSQATGTDEMDEDQTEDGRPDDVGRPE